MKFVKQFLTSLFCIVLFSVPTYSANFEAIVANTLPEAAYRMPVVYDGEDTIYVLGGILSSAFNGDILKYSLTPDSIEASGATLPSHQNGFGVFSGNGEIFYMGGYDLEAEVTTSEIWKIETSNLTNMSPVNNLPYPSFWSTPIWDHKNNIYVVGGYEFIGTDLRTITRYSKDTNTVDVVANLERKTYGASGVWDTTNHVAYTFGGSNSTGGDDGYTEIMKFNPETGNLTVLNQRLPVPLVFSCAVWTGTEAFIIGGSQDMVHSIVRFNPTTEEVTVETVSNFPPNLFSPGCAYVNKLNRIYIVGGDYYDNQTEEWLLSNEIMFIDISRKL